MVKSFVLSAFVLILAGAAAEAVELPQFAEAEHLGVASCSSAQCHGAVVDESDSSRSPLLNEYRTWLRHDRHAQAWKVLGNETSQRIARNLGLGDPREADLCLDCHADNVPPGRRGERFQISDGVGCEACHGGAGPWIRSHTSPEAKHAENVANGMYPTDRAETRAALCVSCHLGNARKPLTHRLMAAGHPRTTFELDTFTHIQPAHFLPNERYRERKEVPSAVQLWAVGQAVAVQQYMAWLEHPTRSRDGAWPEFALYDCYSCHHSMGAQPLTPAASLGLRQGLPRLNEIRILLYGEALAAAGAADAERFERDLRRLNATLGSGGKATAGLAATLREHATRSVERFRAWDPEPPVLRRLLASLSSADKARYYRTYTSAEQVTMAAQAVVSTLARRADESETKPLQQSLDELFAATEQDERFRPETFGAALADLRAGVR